MMFRPARLSRSIGLAWALACQRFADLSARLGLGPIGIRAFLPRLAHRALDADLTRLEMLVRRVLFLVAMDTPLPAPGAARAAGRTGPAPAPAPVPVAAEAPLRPLFPFPAFRLIESDRKPRKAAHRLVSPGGACHPANPARPEDLVPAAALFNRLAALQEALADPASQIARFRRKLARIRADKALPLPVADTPPAACVGPEAPAAWRELSWTLHDAALSWLPILDSG